MNSTSTRIGFFSNFKRRHVLFLLVIVVAAEASRWLTVDALPLSILWPPSGLILGAALLLGMPVVVSSGVLLAFWVMLFQGASPGTAALMAISQVVGVAIATGLYGRAFRSIEQGPGDRLDVSLYLRIGLLAAGVTALAGSSVLLVGLGDELPYSPLNVFLIYFLLEALSILLFAPLSFLVMQRPAQFLNSLKHDLSSRSLRLWYVAALALLLSIWLMPADIDRNYSVAITFTFFPLLCWYVLAARVASVLAVIPVIAVLYVSFSLQGLGGLPRIETIDDIARSLLLIAGLVLLMQVIAFTNQSRVRLLETFRQQANTDFLTGLNNDRALTQKVQQVVNHSRRVSQRKRTSDHHWLVHMQVLDFDQVEDLMGYRASQSLEQMLASRLAQVCDTGAYMARIGSGTYCVITNVIDRHCLEDLVQRLYGAFNDQTLQPEGQATRLRVSISAVDLDDQLEDDSLYLSAATQASLMARNSYPRTQIVQDVKGMMLDRRLMTEQIELIKNALSDNKLVLFAQPICPIGYPDDQVSYEILLRLRTDDGQYLSPASFLPIAETHGFMQQIDQWVVSHTLEALARHPHWLEKTRKCSINLSGVTLSSDSILTYITKVFEATGVPTHKVSFEVTETQHLASRISAEQVTSGLRLLGCGVSLDDFGTGLATFDYLKSFRFDTVKIDGQFVRTILSSKIDQSIVHSICHVARQMGLKTVAEFVETQEIADLLAELGVDYGQGYGLGKPVCLDDSFFNIS